jgi:hypothetical protein
MDPEVQVVLAVEVQEELVLLEHLEQLIQVVVAVVEETVMLVVLVALE